MKKYVLVVLPLLCSVAQAQNPTSNAPVSAPTSDTIELKPHWQAGKKYLQTMRSTVKTSQTIEQKRLDMTQDMAMDMLYEIKNVDEQGAADMELTFRSVQMKMHIQNGAEKTDSVFDSQHPPKKPDPVMGSLAAMIGLKFQMKMSPDGNLLQMQGMDEMRKRMLKAMTLPSGADRAGFEALMKKQLSDANIRKMIEQKSGFSNAYVYPRKAVAVGESWTRKISLDVPMPMTSTATYTLRDHADGTAHIDFNSKFSLNSSDVSPVKTIKVATKMSGDQTGTIDLRESDGQVMKMQTSMRYSGTVSSTVPDGHSPKKMTTQSWPIYAVASTSLESKNLP